MENIDPKTVKRTDLNEFLVSFQHVAGLNRVRADQASLVGRARKKWTEFDDEKDYAVIIYEKDNVLHKNLYQKVKGAGYREGVRGDGKNEDGDDYFLVIVGGWSVTQKGDLSGQMGGGKRGRTKRRRIKRRRTKRRKSNKNSKRKSRKTRR